MSFSHVSRTVDTICDVLVRKYSYVNARTYVKFWTFFEEYFKGIAASYPLVNF